VNKAEGKKKILIISAVFPPEPVVSANISFDLALALSEENLVTVLHPRPTRPMGYDFTNSANVQYPFKHKKLKSYTHPKSTFIGRFRESYSFGKACDKYIATHHNEIDTIYMNTWPLFGQYFVIKAAKRHGIPAVLHIQDIYPEAFTQKLPCFIKGITYEVLFHIERFVTAKSTRIVTISKGMKNLLVSTRNIQPDKIEVVYNWQDETKFIDIEKDEPNKSTEAFTHFMFLGSLGPVANIDNLITAFSRLNTKKVRLTIAGEGSDKIKLKKLVKNLNESRIEFVSAPASKAGSIQSDATILLLSLKKGAAGLALPSKLPAYMFSGKPIIATVDDDSDTAHAIREAGCGWVIEPENPDALAAQMQKSIEMAATELEVIGRKGREYAMTHFSKKANLMKLAATIEETAIL